MEVGTHVMYAGYRYEVKAINGDLLTLTGLPVNVVVSRFDGDGSGTAGPQCTVLATDVTVVGEQGEGA